MAVSKQSLGNHLGKRPRNYAAEIIAERDREKRRTMLAAVPDEFRGLVETHVRNHFKLKAGK